MRAIGPAEDAGGAGGGPPAREAPDIEASTEAYARRFSGRVGGFLLDVQWRITRALLASWPGARILDVGGGHGQLAIPLVRAGFDVTVVGSDATCERRLRDALAPGSYAFCCGDLLRLPFGPGAFDVVLAFRLLPHLRQWERFIGEIGRVARHGVIVDYPDLRSINVVSDRLFGVKKALEGDTRPYRCFRRTEIETTFARHAFAPTAFHPQFILPMAAHRALRSAGLARTLESAGRHLGLTRRFGSPVIAAFSRLAPERATAGGSEAIFG